MPRLVCVLLSVLLLAILVVILVILLWSKKETTPPPSPTPVETQKPPARKGETLVGSGSPAIESPGPVKSKRQVPAVQDFSLWERHLRRAKRYFEFGSGKSTIYASGMPHLERITAVENEKNWSEKVSKETAGDTRVRIIYVDTNSDDSPFGYPKRADAQKAARYITSYDSDMAADLILVDGRFRVACCLDLHPKIGADALVYFDDFYSRPHYHEVLRYFDVWEIGNDSVLLKRKDKIDVSDYLTSVDRHKNDPR